MSAEPRILVRVQEADFDVSEELERLSAGRADVGAVASFVGLVRDRAGGAPVQAMTLEHWPGATERALRRIAEDAAARWPLQGALVVHRVGRLAPGERIVLAAAASPHRHAAFEAAAFLMDWLKTEAPFWKKEETPEGARWVEARESDDAAKARWGGRGR